MQSKNIILILLGLVILGAIIYLMNYTGTTNTTTGTPTTEPVPTSSPVGATPTTSPAEQVSTRSEETIIGRSVDGADVVAYHFGTGAKEILFVGGVHGGYSPNTAKLADDMVAYFKQHADTIPANLSVTIIPHLNPDGDAKSGTAGRFNAHTVDINRNFDCDWAATSMWQSQKVSGGTAAFSEPEAQALRSYVEKYDPAAAVVWFAAEGKVYASACDGKPSSASTKLAATYATAAAYPADTTFDAYTINGDMVNWMAEQGIPAISVLLSDHKNTEFETNLAGIEAVLKAYAE